MKTIQLLQIRSSLLVLLFVGAVSSVGAQKSLKISQTDTKTYALYLQKDWKNLIETANKALSEDIDFFYLRTRLGIAYYEQEKYRLAAPHFAKALEMIPGDEIILEYLYYAYLFSGQKLNALKLSDSFPHNLKQKLKPQEISGMQSFGANYGVQQTRDVDGLKFVDLDGSADIKGEQTINKTLNYFNVGFTTINQKDALIHFNYQNTKALNLYRLQENNLAIAEFDLQNVQHQFYFSHTKLLADNWSLLSSATLLAGSFESVVEIVTTGMFGRRQTQILNTAFGGLLASGRFFYNKPHYQWDIGLTASALGGSGQIQAGSNVRLFPFANYRAYADLGVNLHYQDELSPVFNALIGVGLYKNIFAEAFYNGGNMQNYSSFDGLVVYNANELVSSQTGVGVFAGGQKLSINLQWMVSDKSRQLDYNTTIDTQDQQTYNYKTQLITGGFLWRF